MKVDFVIAGAQKSGTTFLRAALFDHPKICFSKAKEAHFFDTDRNFRWAWRPYYRAYHQEFAHATNCQILGDKTPSYMFCEEVPARIWRYNRKMKLIMILRNPVDRAYSQYQFLKRSKNIKETFLERLRMERQLVLQRTPTMYRGALIARGHYVEQIRRMQRYFPDDQLCFLQSEELRNAPERALNKVCSFLGVDAALLKEPRADEMGPKREYPPMTVEERSFLAGEYYFEIKLLETLMNWDCSDWLKSLSPGFNIQPESGIC